MLSINRIINWAEIQNFSIGERYIDGITIESEDLKCQLIIHPLEIRIVFPRLFLKEKVKDHYKSFIKTSLEGFNFTYQHYSFFKRGVSSLVIKFNKSITIEHIQKIVSALIDLEALYPTLTHKDLLDNKREVILYGNVEDFSGLKFNGNTFNTIVASHPNHYISRETKALYFVGNRLSHLIFSETNLLLNVGFKDTIEDLKKLQETYLLYQRKEF